MRLTKQILDTEFAAIRHRQYLRELEGQIQDMLCDKTVDYRQIVKELDDKCKYSTQITVDVVQILHKIKQSGLYDNQKKKLQKVLNYYAVEHDNMIVLKP